MSAASHGRAIGRRVVRRMAQGFGRDGVLFDLVRPAGDLHFTDVAKEPLELVRAREGSPLQRLLQRATLLLGAEGEFQSVHDHLSDQNNITDNAAACSRRRSTRSPHLPACVWTNSLLMTN